MVSSEVLLLKVFDSRRDGRARFGCHSAVKDRNGPNIHRESIEVRCLVVLEADCSSRFHEEAGAAKAARL